MTTTVQRPARENPVLFPAGAERVAYRVNPARLIDARTEIGTLADRIGQMILNAGYIFPKDELTERHAVTFCAEGGLYVQFPPPPPGLRDTVTVVDTAWRSSDVTITEITAASLGHPNARLYFDLSTGLWITFSTQLLPQSISRPYRSHATRYPAPQEDTR